MSGTINTDTTWELAESPYVVQSNITVIDSVTLTIEPGVIVKFDIGDIRLEIQGTLSAEGTENDNIYFTSYYDDSVGGDTNGDGDETTPNRGDWAMVYFNEADAGTNIDHCLFRYAGKNCNWAYHNYRAHCLYFNNSPVTISNSIIEQNDGSYTGSYYHSGVIWIENYSSIILSDVIVQNNDYTGIYMTENCTLDISNSEISANGYRGIEIGDNTTISISSSEIINNAGNGLRFADSSTINLNIDNLEISGNTGTGLVINPENLYCLNENLIYEYNGSGNLIQLCTGYITEDTIIPSFTYLVHDLTINDQITVTIESGTILKLNEDRLLSIFGKLEAIGTEQDSIYFTSYLDDSIGGDTNGDGNATSPYAGYWEGIYLDYADDISSLSYCNLRYAGNYNNNIGYYNTILLYDQSELSMDNCIIEYSGESNVNSYNAAILVYRDCELSLNNTAIRNSSYNGLHIYGSGSYGNNTVQIDSVEILNNGYYGLIIGGCNDGNDVQIADSIISNNGYYGLYIADNASISLLNTAIINNSNCGLYMADCATIDLAIENLEISGNAGTGLYINPENLHVLNENVIYEDNATNNRIVINAGYITEDTILPNFTYKLFDLIINDQKTLTIEPGAILKFNSDALFTVNGSLTAEGTEQDSIYFTSFYDDSIGGDTNGNGNETLPYAGFWEGIYLDYTDEITSLSYCKLRYAGDVCYSGNTHYCTLYLDNYSHLSINNSIIEYNGDNTEVRNAAIYAYHHSNLYMNNTIICNSSYNGIYLYGNYSASVQITNSEIFDNGHYGIYAGPSISMDVSNSMIQNNVHTGLFCNGSNVIIQDVESFGNGWDGLHLPYILNEFTGVNCYDNYHFDVSLPFGKVHTAWDEDLGNSVTGNIGVYGGTLGETTEWEDEHQYVIFEPVTIPNNVTLVLEPGTIMKFNPGDNRITINGRLIAEGTENDSIYFTSYYNDEIGGDTNRDSTATSPASGDWQLLNFYNADPGSSFDYCKLDFAGRFYNPPTGDLQYRYNCISLENGSINLSNSIIENIYGSDSQSYYYPAALWLENSSGSTINNVTIRNCDKYAVHSDSYFEMTDCNIYDNSGDAVWCDTFFELTNCNIYDNAGFAYTVVPSLINLNFYEAVNSWNNGHCNANKLMSGSIPESVVWHNEYQFVIAGVVTVPDGVSLMIEEGSIIKFTEGDTRIDVSGGLIAEGTAADHIYFTSYADDSIGGDTNASSSAPYPGYWRRLWLNGLDQNSHLDYCEFRYGGGTWNYSVWVENSVIPFDNCIFEYSGSSISSNTSYSALMIEDNADVVVESCVFRNNQNTGLGAAGTNQSVAIVDCEFYDNGNQGMRIPGNTGYLENNTFYDNFWADVSVNPEMISDIYANNNYLSAVRICSGSVLSDALWNGNWQYQVEGDFSVNAGATLIIEPGAMFKFWGDYLFTVNGSLTAQGTPAEKIIFTSIHNDSYGGDSNNNYFETTPNPGDWKGISFNNSTAGNNLSWMIVSYAGGGGNYPAINLQNSEVDMNSVIVIYNEDQGIYVNDSSILGITHSDIYDNGYGLYNNNSSNNINAGDIFWGDESGPYHAVTNVSGQGNEVSDYVIFDDWRSTSIDNPWQEFTSPATSGQFYDIEVLDLDGDEYPDLAGASSSAGLKLYYRPDFEMWAEMESPLPTGSVLSLLADDFNNDGLDDLLAGCTSGFKYLQRTETGWEINDLLPGVGVNYIQQEYVDADGEYDLVCGCNNNQGIKILLRDGDSWTESVTVGEGITFNTVKAADLNQDDNIDLIATSFTDNGIMLWHGDGEGNWIEQPALDYGSAFFGLDVKDVDFNGFPDLIASGNTATVSIIFYLNQDGDNYIISNSPTSFGIYNDIVVTDMNGDNYYDMAATNQYAGIQTWLGTPELYWEYWYHPQDNEMFKRLEVADVTLDNTPDVIAATYGSGIKIWSNRSPYGIGETCFSVNVTELNFDNVLLNYSRTLPVEITNVSSDTLLDVVFYTTNPAFQVAEAGVPGRDVGPLVFLPGEIIDLEITFSPQIAGWEEEGLIIHSIPEVKMLPLLGLGVTEGMPEWVVELEIANAAGDEDNSETLTLGTGIGATDFVDFIYNEHNLPPLPPQSMFDARFLLEGYEGVLRDIRDYEVVYHSYQISWQVGDGGYPVTLSWNPAIMPDGEFLIHDLLGGIFVDTLDMATCNEIILEEGIDSYPRLQIEYSAYYSNLYGFDEGWNLSSLSVTPNETLIDSMFASNISSFCFDTELQQYQQVEEWNTGTGYWIEFPGDADYQLFGRPLHHLSLNLSEGWNIIGSLFEPLLTNDIICEPAGSIISVFGLDSGYYLAENIIPTHGYWVEVSQDCNLILDTDNSRYQAIRSEITANANKKTQQQFRDENLIFLNMNELSELCFGFNDNATDGIDPELNEVNLPPLPPASVFDCRFLLPDNSSSLIDIRNSSQTEVEFLFTWQAPEYPFLISWNADELGETGNYQLTDAINGEFINLNMRDTEQLLLTENESYITQLLISITLPVENTENEIPLATALGNNYPNPFNPVTTIPYQISEKGQVIIDIYNIKGQKVVSLVDEMQEPGYYQAIWQGNDAHQNSVSAGVYFYQLRAGKTVIIRKMVVLK
ncbi:MAG: right-handed parallel beta-helix repeat-containing protein [Candidatus Cloacimonetes bacterium]|nr:right-handed parallel beta-helix repeat-containing protein [Candidatus Cloacimonadota bacterium]